MLNTPNPLADLLRRSFYVTVKSLIAAISTLRGQIANVVACYYKPKQNLNGYDSVWAGGAKYNILNYISNPSARNGITPSVVTDSAGNKKYQLNGTVDPDATNNFYNMNYTSSSDKNIPTGKWIMKCFNDNAILQVYKAWQGGSFAWFSETSVGAENQRAFIISGTDEASYIRALVPNGNTHQFSDEEIKAMIYSLDGVNMFVGGSMISGKQYNTSGELVTRAERCSTPKYSITGGNSITAVWTSSQSIWSGTRYIILFWDSNNNLLARSTNFTSGTIRVAPNNAAYVAFTFYSSGNYDVNSEINELTIISPVNTKDYVPYSNFSNFDKVSTDTVTVEGKNAFSFNAGTNYAGGSGSMSYTKTPNTVNMVATGTSGAQYFGVKLARRFDMAKTYTLSFKARKIVKGVNGNPLIQCVIYGSTDGSTFTTINRLNVLQANITQGVVYSLSGQYTGYKYYRFYFYNNSNTPVSVGENTEYFDIQFEEGSSVTTFEPYSATSYTSAISPAQYAGILGMQNGYFINNYVVLETTWGTGTNVTVLGECERRAFSSQISNVDLLNREVALCNCAPYLAGWSTDKNHFYITSAGGLYIYLPIDTPDSQPIKVIYPTTTSTLKSTTKHHVAIPKGNSFVYAQSADEVEVKYKEK